MHWTEGYTRVRENAAKNNNVFNGTVMQLKQKLSYVRDLTHADWTHSWKAEAVIGCDQPITCENGVVYMHLSPNKEVFFVSLPLGSEYIQKIEDLRKRSIVWRLKFNEIRQWVK